MTFSINQSFHETHVTVYLSNGVKMHGVISLNDGVWLSTLDGMNKQQLNPALIATVMPSEPKTRYNGEYA